MIRKFISIMYGKFKSQPRPFKCKFKSQPRPFLSEERFIELLENKIDEKLNFYFRWRLPVQLDEQKPIFVHSNDGHRLYLDSREPFMTMHMLEHGEWETPVRRELKRMLTQNSTFIDIGANIGLHAIYASTLVGPSGRIVSLEPHPLTYELHRKNLEINGLLDRVKLICLAASDQAQGNITFEYFSEHPGMSGIKVSPRILEKFKGSVETVEVETTTVDTLVKTHNLSPDLIKIDVEGFEHKVLQGCSETIKNNPKVAFMVEYEKEMAESVLHAGIGVEIANFFSSQGFSISRIDEHKLQQVSHLNFQDEKRGDYIFTRQ